MLWTARLKCVGLVLLVILAVVCAREGVGHLREGRRGPAVGCFVAAIACLAGAVALVPAVLEMVREVGLGRW
jgi:hypothetical protein